MINLYAAIVTLLVTVILMHFNRAAAMRVRVLQAAAWRAEEWIQRHSLDC